MVRELTNDEAASAEFRHLLWLAVEVEDAELDMIAGNELPSLTVLGVVDDGSVVAFVAFDSKADPLTIEYIAVAESTQGRGHGRALVEAVRSRAGESMVYAQTDDDAVGFYRRLGFAVTERDRDPRWPERRRYDCLLGWQSSS